MQSILSGKEIELSRLEWVQKSTFEKFEDRPSPEKTINPYGCDPIWHFSNIRYNNWKFRHNSSGQKKLINSFTSKKPQIHRNVSIKCLQLSYFITNSTEPILLSAYESFHACPEFIQYVEEEQGHESFFLEALKSIGCVPSEPSPTLKTFVELFSEAACHNPLAFVCMLDHFEGIAYTEESNQYGNFLNLHPGFEIAATLVDRHHRINIDHGHGAIGYTLANFLPQIDQKMVAHACELLDVFSKVYEEVLEELASPMLDHDLTSDMAGLSKHNISRRPQSSV